MRPFTLDRLDLLHRSLRGHTFVRHDVDVSLAAAYRMAEWEQARQISSTYYLMATSPFYTWQEALDGAHFFRDLGHDVGLHLDARLGAAPPIMGLPISYHCPTPDLLWQDVTVFENAYALTWKGLYYSDSRGQFAYGDPEDHPGPWPIQVNLHAEHWFEPDWLERRNISAGVYEAFYGEPMMVAA